MKRRYALALAFAIAFATLDALYFPFLLSYGNTQVQVVHHILYGPFFGAAWLLEWVDMEFGSSLVKSPWSFSVFFLNWFCYAALGFLVGLKLGRRIWKEP